MASVLIEVFARQDLMRATGHLSPPTNKVCDLKSLLLSWNTCSFMACVWLPPFQFFFFLPWQSVTSSLFIYSSSFSSLLLTVFFSQHRIINAFSHKDVLFTVFGFLNVFFNFSIVVLRTTSNRFLQKTMAIFLNFIVKTAKI